MAAMRRGEREIVGRESHELGSDGASFSGSVINRSI